MAKYVITKNNFIINTIITEHNINDILSDGESGFEISSVDGDLQIGSIWDSNLNKYVAPTVASIVNLDTNNLQNLTSPLPVTFSFNNNLKENQSLSHFPVEGNLEISDIVLDTGSLKLLINPQFETTGSETVSGSLEEVSVLDKYSRKVHFFKLKDLENLSFNQN